MSSRKNEVGKELEERLKGEIDVFLRERSSLSPLTSLPADRPKAERLKQISDQIETRELLLESMRVTEVVSLHEELHPPTVDDCPICFDPVRDDLDGDMIRLLCCGWWICRKCKDGAKWSKCPLCREHKNEDMMCALRKLAEGGRAWAETDLGQHYETGNDLEEALKWYRLAAMQKYPLALFHLARLYYNGSDGAMETSDEKARALAKTASDLGNAGAHELFGLMCFRGDGGEQDKLEAVRCFTLAVATKVDPSADSEFYLGSMFRGGGGGLEKSLVRAKHYLEKAARKGQVTSYCNLALTLRCLGEEQYLGNTSIPGHSCIPQVLFWMRKNAPKKSNSAQLIADMESHGESFCSNCKTDASFFSEKLKRCAGCRAVWFCGKHCQMQHWRTGHKIDCTRH